MNENISDKERFFSKVSHDLRGSFTSILGFSDLLSDPSETLSSDEIIEFSSRLSNQSNETFELLVNFVNWLKLENYHYGLTNEKVELVDVLLDVKTQQQKKIVKRNISVTINVDEGEFIMMDYDILNSIITNVFIFLIKTCSENSNINIQSINSDTLLTSLEISASYNNSESSFLQNIDLGDLNNELSFPIIFAIKFTELSGGKFNFTVDNGSTLRISIHLPKK